MSCHFLSLILFFERSIQKLSVSCFQSFLIILSHCHYNPVLGLYLVLFSFDFVVIGFCPYYILILSYFYAGYYLFRIFLGPFLLNLFLFIQLVPFFASKGNNPLTLPCVFFVQLVSFYPKPLSKKTQPLFLFALLVRAHFIYFWFFVPLCFLLSPFHSSLVLFLRCPFYASLSIFYTSLYLFCLACVFFTQHLSQKRHNLCFFLHSSVRSYICYYYSYSLVSSFLSAREW